MSGERKSIIDCSYVYSTQEYVCAAITNIKVSAGLRLFPPSPDERGTHVRTRCIRRSCILFVNAGTAFFSSTSERDPPVRFCAFRTNMHTRYVTRSGWCLNHRRIRTELLRSFVCAAHIYATCTTHSVRRSLTTYPTKTHMMLHMATPLMLSHKTCCVKASRLFAL